MNHNSIAEEWLVFCGSLVHSVDVHHPLVTLENKILGVRNGKIVFLEEASQLSGLQEKFNFSPSSVYHLKDGEFLMPGLVDTHIHAPQYKNSGLGLGLPLLQWLEKYTFPCEARCKDLEFARNIYRKVVRRTIANGTTTAAYFATIHLEASLLLCDIIEQEGQRAFVGKVNSDCNLPEWYCEDTEASIQLTKLFIDNVLKRKNPLLLPIITPRFAVSCSGHLMSSLGDVANLYDLPIQSHLSETKDECSKVISLFPDNDHYTQVYHRCKLLTSKTVMAHGVHLSDDELRLLADQKVGIAHCPNSNISILSGLCDVRRLLDNGLKVGLGTDVAAGYSSSILDAMKQAIQTSFVLSMPKIKEFHPITYKEAFYLATLGGSRVLGLDKKIGNFEIGKELDALLIDVDAKDGPIDSFTEDLLEDRIQRFIYLGDDRNIRKVFVAGKEIKSVES